MPPRNVRSWRYSLHRGVALGLTIVLHLVVFVMITRPVADEEDQKNVQPQREQALRLRFIPWLKPSPSPTLTTTDVHVAVVRARRAKLSIAFNSPKTSATTIAPVRTTSTSVSVVSVARSVPPSMGEADGGFADQLRAAQRDHSVGPLPGSDTPRVGGIPLIDPKTQGVGAVMRQAQRLFGVTNHHCIDVDTWRSMTPQQLLARHISPSDVDKSDAENQCTRPMGLSF